jgi:hypothetical protein
MTATLFAIALAWRLVEAARAAGVLAHLWHPHRATLLIAIIFVSTLLTWASGPIPTLFTHQLKGSIDDAAGRYRLRRAFVGCGGMRKGNFACPVIGRLRLR